MLLDWTKDYGNFYQLRLLTDNRVRIFVTHLLSMENSFTLQIITVEPHHVKVLHLNFAFISAFDTLIITPKAILATQFDAFEKGMSCISGMVENLRSTRTLGLTFYSQFKSFLGEGVFNAYGALPPTFTSHTLTDQV